MEDVQETKAVLGETTAAKMTILYNDRLLKGGKSDKELVESPEVQELRENIRGLQIRHSETTSILAFLDGLEDHEFPSSKDFITAFIKLGPTAKQWMTEMTQIDKLHLIQYAVGENERIMDPLAPDPDYL